MRTSAATPSSPSTILDVSSPVTTINTHTKDHLGLLKWAEKFGAKDLQWAVEDCRHLSRRLEKDLLGAGQSIVRVPPKLMANVRNSARTYGKSDPIDALAVARAALREPDLPVAHLDGPEREVRLLVDHRQSLVAERTRMINRLRWHLHEIDSEWEPKARSLDRRSSYDTVQQHLQDVPGLGPPGSPGTCSTGCVYSPRRSTRSRRNSPNWCRCRRPHH